MCTKHFSWSGLQDGSDELDELRVKSVKIPYHVFFLKDVLEAAQATSAGTYNIRYIPNTFGHFSGQRPLGSFLLWLLFCTTTHIANPARTRHPVTTRTSLGAPGDTLKACKGASQALRASSTGSFPPSAWAAWSAVLSSFKPSAAIFRQLNLISLPGLVHQGQV